MASAVDSVRLCDTSPSLSGKCQLILMLQEHVFFSERRRFLSCNTKNIASNPKDTFSFGFKWKGKSKVCTRSGPISPTLTWKTIPSSAQLKLPCFRWRGPEILSSKKLLVNQTNFILSNSHYFFVNLHIYWQQAKKHHPRGWASKSGKVAGRKCYNGDQRFHCPIIAGCCVNFLFCFMLRGMNVLFGFCFRTIVGLDLHEKQNKDIHLL